MSKKRVRPTVQKVKKAQPAKTAMPYLPDKRGKGKRQMSKKGPLC